MGCDNNDGPTRVETEHEQQRDSGTTELGTSALGTSETKRGAEPGVDQYLTIRPTDDGVATFEATVDGHIKSADDLDAVIAGLGKSAEDAIVNEPRQYILTGRLTNLRIRGPAAAFLDGERIA